MLKKIVVFSVCLSYLLVIRAAHAEEIRYSNNDSDLYFSTQFLRTVFEQNQDNFVISPLSLYAATVLLANGAEGDSQAELGNILGFSDEEETKLDNLEQINTALKAYMKKKPQFEINNSIWGDTFKPEYQEKTKNELMAESKQLPNHTSVINDWVAEKTNGKIQNLLAPSSIDSSSLYLVNTIQFNAKWETPFSESNTRLSSFHSLDGQFDDVYLMERRGMMDYYQDNTMQALRIPYQNGDVMQIFLPKEGVDFRRFVQKLHARNLYLRYYKVPVKLVLPRFNLNYKEEDMIKFFKSWGITNVFNPQKANLSGLSDVPHLISKIIHQVNIEVGEKGTEASAATVMEASETSLGPGRGRTRLSKRDWEIAFIANRPFVFAINNGDFIGVYTNGSAEKLGEGGVTALPLLTR